MGRRAPAAISAARDGSETTDRTSSVALALVAGLVAAGLAYAGGGAGPRAIQAIGQS